MIIFTPARESHPFPLSETERGNIKKLLDGDAFGEVAGFVHVAAAEDGDVIGE
jgi:hypothetical protein